MPIDLPIDVHPLPYEHKLLERRVEDVDLLVIHCTELPELSQARTYGERVIYADTGTGASGHFYIERDGRIVRYVDPLRVAHHTRGHNARSIGVELVNRGRYPDWFSSTSQTMTDPYTEQQVSALLRLLAALREQFPALDSIAGHEDLDTARIPATDDSSLQVFRKRDPGPMFPWAQVLAQGSLKRISTQPP